MVSPQAGLVRRESAFRNVADRYGVTPHQAESLVAYHAQLRSSLNEAFIAASTGKRFKTEQGTVAKTSGLIATFLKVLPFGNAAEVASGVITIADSHFSRKELDSFAALVPAFGGLEHLNELTKSLATQILEASVDNIKDLTAREAKQSAKDDFKVLTKQVSAGKFKDSDTISTGSALDLDDDETRSQNSLKENIADLVQEISTAVIERKKESENGRSGSLVHQHHQDEKQARKSAVNEAIEFGKSANAQNEGQHASQISAKNHTGYTGR